MAPAAAAVVEEEGAVTEEQVIQFVRNCTVHARRTTHGILACRRISPSRHHQKNRTPGLPAASHQEPVLDLSVAVVVVEEGAAEVLVLEVASAVVWLVVWAQAAVLLLQNYEYRQQHRGPK